MKNKELMLNPCFIGGLFVLLLNDFYLKQAFGNFLTGKLSDFAGLLIFPLFIAAVAPRWKQQAALVTGIGFMLWKLPLMTPVIDFVNHATGLGICRVIDYTDYMALAILPLSHYLIKRQGHRAIVKPEKLRYAAQLALSAVAFFAFCATSVPPDSLFDSPVPGTVYINKSYTIKLPKDSVIHSIRQLGYNCDYYEKDSLAQRYADYYQTDNILCGENGVATPDTIANVKYRLTEVNPDKTKLTVINVTLRRKDNIQSWRMMKRLSKTYSSWLKKNLIEEID